jgi:hypothetical protein
MTDQGLEKMVIDTLVSYPPTGDCWKDPIHAVDEAVRYVKGWSSAETRTYVQGLVEKNLVVIQTKVIKRAESLTANPEWWWARPDDVSVSA